MFPIVKMDTRVYYRCRFYIKFAYLLKQLWIQYIQPKQTLLTVQRSHRPGDLDFRCSLSAHRASNEPGAGPLRNARFLQKIVPLDSVGPGT